MSTIRLGDTAPNFYMCPQMMLGSEELVNAAKDDKNDWAYYGVASHFNGKEGCGRCYQISYLPYCGEYWADDKDGQICCKSGDECTYTVPYDCYQSQVGHCCLDGTCDNCAKWSTSDPGDIGETPDKDSCESAGGTFCPGWCPGYCKGYGGQCDKCTVYPTTPLIVQTFDTGIDCTPPDNDTGGQFDIYLGAGGLGANVGCAGPSSDKQTYGGGFYGGNLDDWPDIQAGHRNGGVTRIDMCDKISTVPGLRINDADWNGEKNWGKEMINACKFAMGNDVKNPTNPYHGNWAVRYKEVECPEGLTKVTGLRLKDPSLGYNKQTLSKPSVDLVKSSGREGSTADGFPGFTSSMMDCCKPSCSQADIIDDIKTTGNEVDPDYSSFFMCDKNGKRVSCAPDDVQKAWISDTDGKTFCGDSSLLPQCKDKIPDSQSGCQTDSDCCSNVCSTGEYYSMCCPLFHEPDPNNPGGCIATDSKMLIHSSYIL